MKNLIQKSLFTLPIISMFFIPGVQATTFSKLMKLGIVSSTPFGKEVVIYNDDQTKCLSTSGKKRPSAKSLDYATCRMDSADTWLITAVGKIKNKSSGKCLSTPKEEDNLILVHCNFMYSRDYITHNFIILDHLIDDDHEGEEIADIRY